MTSTEDPKQRYEALLFNSPSRWETVRVGDAGHVQLGRQKSPGNRSNKFPTPYVRAGNITWNGLQLEDTLEMEFTPDERETFQLHPGDVLLSEASGSASEVGKPAIWPEGMGLFCFQNTVVRFRSKILVPRYSMHLFTAYAQRGIFAAQSRGVGIHHLSARRFAELLIPIPPQAEQERIADRIEELFTDLDAGVAALQRVQKKLKRYRAALLHAAVTGRLTADWRAKHGDGGETGSQLLERILVARREAWEERTLAEYEEKGRQPPSGWSSRYVDPKLSVPLDGVSIPKSWAWSNTDQMMGVITSGSRDWSPYYGRGTGTFIMAGNVRMGRLDLAKRQPVDPPPEHRDRKRSQVEVDDLLVTIVGANTGDVCRVTEQLNEHFVCQSVALMRPVEPGTSEWLETWFTAQSGAQSQFAKVMYGAGRPHLSFDQIQSTVIPLPPITEQQLISEIVSEKLSEMEAMETAVARAVRRSGRLRQAILKSAFEGKLVPQNPDDEPASELLARIQAEAEAEVAAAPKRTPRKRKTTKKTSKKETA